MKPDYILDALGEPQIHEDALVVPGAVVLGDVRVARGASIWFFSVLRTDLANTLIEIGEDTNIQDGTLVHVDNDISCMVGARVTVGHRALIHAVTVGDDCLIGMGATLLSGAKIGKGSIIAAGAVVPEGMEIPDGVVAAGIPAKIRRETTEEDRARIEHSWRVYTGMRDFYIKEMERGNPVGPLPQSAPKR